VLACIHLKGTPNLSVVLFFHDISPGNHKVVARRNNTYKLARWKIKNSKDRLEDNLFLS